MHTFDLQARNRGVFFGPHVPMSTYRFRKIMDEVGAASYERRVKYGTLMHRPAEEIAGYLVGLGDWHLLFHADEAGAEAYRRAREELAAAGAPPEAIDAVFTPRSPILLPAFSERFVDPSTVDDYFGYVDVAIDLDGYGRSTRTTVLSRSSAARREIVARLEDHIDRSQFRPAFVNGVRAAASRVELRYYFRY